MPYVDVTEEDAKQIHKKDALKVFSVFLEAVQRWRFLDCFCSWFQALYYLLTFTKAHLIYRFLVNTFLNRITDLLTRPKNLHPHTLIDFVTSWSILIDSCSGARVGLRLKASVCLLYSEHRNLCRVDVVITPALFSELGSLWKTKLIVIPTFGSTNSLAAQSVNRLIFMSPKSWLMYFLMLQFLRNRLKM